jgi:hypothetical protein
MQYAGFRKSMLTVVEFLEKYYEIDSAFGRFSSLQNRAFTENIYRIVVKQTGYRRAGPSPRIGYPLEVTYPCSNPSIPLLHPQVTP